MNLSDLKPQNVAFSLCGLNLVFRPFTIADDLKSQEICGGQDKMREVFEKFDFEKISKIAWYQLTFESQKKILDTTEAIIIDPESGEEVKVETTPIDRFRRLFVGPGDQILLITNLIKCKGLNLPDFDNSGDLKKWVDQMSQELNPLTGR